MRAIIAIIPAAAMATTDHRGKEFALEGELESVGVAGGGVLLVAVEEVV